MVIIRTLEKGEGIRKSVRARAIGTTDCRRAGV